LECEWVSGSGAEKKGTGLGEKQAEMRADGMEITRAEELWGVEKGEGGGCKGVEEEEPGGSPQPLSPTKRRHLITSHAILTIVSFYTSKASQLRYASP
jgi:hypothetical protein